MNTKAPEFSIIIAVYNDWGLLERCLGSLDQQKNCPKFEVIVVDDGSEETAPDSIRQRNGCYPITLVRQPHSGIAAARNRGIQEAQSGLVVFTDADCRLQADCLSALKTALLKSPKHQCFQLHLVGDCSSLVGRAEELRLIELQKRTQQPTGCIRYLNTAGFAIRRARIPASGELFDPSALRAEDTLLLANLIENQELPFFVSDAVVQHSVSLSFIECFRRDVRSAWLEGSTFEKIAGKGVRVRMRPKELVSMIWSTWTTAGSRSIGRQAWFLLVARESIERVIGMVYGVSRIGKDKRFEESVPRRQA